MYIHGQSYLIDSGGSSGSVIVSSSYTDNYLLTGLVNGASYTVSIVGNALHFWSDTIQTINIGLGKYVISVYILQ